MIAVQRRGFPVLLLCMQLLSEAICFLLPHLVVCCFSLVLRVFLVVLSPCIASSLSLSLCLSRSLSLSLSLSCLPLPLSLSFLSHSLSLSLALSLSFSLSLSPSLSLSLSLSLSRGGDLRDSVIEERAAMLEPRLRGLPARPVFLGAFSRLSSLSLCYMIRTGVLWLLLLLLKMLRNHCRT